jgi:hypothetical protein
LAHSPGASLLRTAVNEIPLANRESSLLTAAAPGVPAPATDDWETLTLAGAKSWDGQPETYRVRALRRDTLDRDMLEHVPDVIPPELQQAFEQSGHRVVQQREIVPVQMQDGRRLVVPVDHIEIHYVGQPSL